jgi:hypothetical protein
VGERLTEDFTESILAMGLEFYEKRERILGWSEYSGGGVNRVRRGLWIQPGRPDRKQVRLGRRGQGAGDRGRVRRQRKKMDREGRWCILGLVATDWNTLTGAP